MGHQGSRLSVVVGIDGFEAAIHAAIWAAAEAVCRDIPLRLVHVIVPGSEAVRVETECAEAALGTAASAVEASGIQVKIETAILRGRINAVLVQESRSAEIICVGTHGLRQHARQRVGSTATAMIRSAYCPAAVIRAPDAFPPEFLDVAAVVGDESADGDSVLDMAIAEARLRRASLLVLGRFSAETAAGNQLGRRMAPWLRGHSDVDVEVVALQSSVAQFLAETTRSISLAVVGSEDAREMNQLGGAMTGHPWSGHACSVLVVPLGRDDTRCDRWTRAHVTNP
jgi:nucleotide-binding universal stress UspA family protein